MSHEDLKSWLYAMITMIILSSIVMLIQGFIGRRLEIAFEICIFHIPSLILIIVYAWLRRSQNIPSKM